MRFSRTVLGQGGLVGDVTGGCHRTPGRQGCPGGSCPLPPPGVIPDAPCTGWAVRACAHRHVGPRVPQLEESNPQAGDGGRIWMR